MPVGTPINSVRLPPQAYQLPGSNNIVPGRGQPPIATKPFAPIGPNAPTTPSSLPPVSPSAPTTPAFVPTDANPHPDSYYDNNPDYENFPLFGRPYLMSPDDPRAQIPPKQPSNSFFPEFLRPLFGPLVSGLGESLFSPAPEPDYAPIRIMPGAEPPNPGQFIIGTYSGAFSHVDRRNASGGWDTTFYDPPIRTSLISLDEIGRGLYVGFYPAPHAFDSYGNTTLAQFPNIGSFSVGPLLNPQPPLNDGGTAAPTAPPPERTPDFPPPFRTVPGENPEILPFPGRRKFPATPPNRTPQPQPEPDPTPAPDPPLDPVPSEPELPPSDPNPEPEPQTPPETPEPPLKPQPEPNPTPTPPPAPVPPVEPEPRVPTPATPAPITVPGAVPIPAPITVPDTIPTPGPVPVPAPTTIPAPQPVTKPYPAPAPIPAPAEPQPEPIPRPPIKPNPHPEIPSDPDPAPTPVPARPQPTPQPVTDPDPDIQEWNPSNDPAILPGSIPLPNDALPLTIPPSNPTPQTAPITPTNAIVPASPVLGGTTPAIPTTVVPQIPPGAKPIYQPNPGPGQIVPAGNPNLDPCKPIGGDLCQGQISDVVKSNSDKIQQLDLKTVGNTAALAAITAALLATPVMIKKFLKCEGTEPAFGTEVITVPAFLIPATLKNFERLADIEAQVCLKSAAVTAIATVPEWWQLRPEARRPQAILVFRELRTDNTLGNDHYAITIPHFNQSTPPSTAPLTSYKKGNFEGILTLNDNSKLIVNCKDAEECSRVIGRLSAFIDRAQLTNSSTKIGQRSGLPFKEITVKAFRLDYYPNGVKTMQPLYLKSYS